MTHLQEDPPCLKKLSSQAGRPGLLKAATTQARFFQYSLERMEYQQINCMDANTSSYVTEMQL